MEASSDRFDVVGLGYCALDYLCVVERYPELDEKVGMSDFAIQGGGITATAMATVCRLGGRARFVGKVGDDDFGRRILSGLEEEGVDVSRVSVQLGGTSQFSFVVVHRRTGKRTIFAHGGTARLGPSEISRDDILCAKVLQIDAHHYAPAVVAASWARESEIPVVMDAGSLREGSEELLRHVDHLIASELFARQFVGSEDALSSAQKFLVSERGKRTFTAVTLGPLGCLYAQDADINRQPAFEVDVVDTTGAGDVFHGAFCFGLSRGWNYPDIVEFASAVAALKCTKLGGRAGIPTLSEALDFLQSRSDNPFWRAVPSDAGGR